MALEASIPAGRPVERHILFRIERASAPEPGIAPRSVSELPLAVAV